MSANNLTVHSFHITHADRTTQNGHNTVVAWLTGLSGAGKSTLADAVSRHLYAAGVRHYILDGDNTRTGLCANLGFSAADRTENIRRVAQTSQLMCDAGLVVIVSLISPTIADRNMAKEIIGDDSFLEIFVSCQLSECIQRDPKGLYKKALTGEITHFTGIDSPYEVPQNPDLILHTDTQTVDASSGHLFDLIIRRIQKV
jgi:adenylylsulfate kinase